MMGIVAEEIKMLDLARRYAGYTFYVEPIERNIPEGMAMCEDQWREQKEEELRGQQLSPAFDYLKFLEDRGDFHYITVRNDKELVGHFGLSFTTNVQTGKRVAGNTFVYIKPEHRKGVLGVKLIKFVRDYSFLCGAEEFSIGYRVTGVDLDPILRRCGMKKIDTVYTVGRQMK